MYIIRKLELNDFKKGFIDLLCQLRPVLNNGSSAENSFIQVYNTVNKDTKSSVFVVESDTIIVATVTLVCIPKFIYGGRCLGQIEDLVVHSMHRNKGIGTKLVQHCVDYGIKTMNCFKIALCARPNANSFYSKIGFKSIGRYFSMYKNETIDKDSKQSEHNDSFKCPRIIRSTQVSNSIYFPQNYFD